MTLFLVKWFGYGHAYDRWEPISSFLDKEIVINYMNDVAEQMAEGDGGEEESEEDEPDEDDAEFIDDGEEEEEEDEEEEEEEN